MPGSPASVLAATDIAKLKAAFARTRAASQDRTFIEIAIPT